MGNTILPYFSTFYIAEKMKSLINIQIKDNQQLVSARDLHKNLGLTTRFSKWVGQNFNGFEEGQDFMSVTTVTDMPNGGVKPIQDYLLTIDMAKELCMMSKTEKGKERKLATIKDVKDINLEDLYQLADLLGMSDIYLGGRKE